MPSWEIDGKQHACIFILPVCCFCGPHPDWRALSKNMAGRQYESLVKFCPLKWYSITFWWASFCSKPHLTMIQNSRAVHGGMSPRLKPDQNNGFDISCFNSTGNDINRRWWYIENLKAFFWLFFEKFWQKKAPWLAVTGVTGVSRGGFMGKALLHCTSVVLIAHLFNHVFKPNR